ncbi:MAG: protein kinase domain-containing protein [Pseudomonadota bacterium]
MQVARAKPSFYPQGEEGAQFYEPGYVIAGRYRIRRALGRGGMGSVYLAEDLVLGESGVAIKVLQRGGSEDRLAINRFLSEVRLTHKIQHENVVRTFDFGQDGDSIYYTMEYLAGESLQVVIRNGGLPYRTVVDMASQLMRGLAAVHSVGVVHRDLKPANVIVASDGTLKITDFGIARAVTAPTTMFASDVFGTLRYVAPEALQGEAATKAVDFYALGVILFELLTGTAPLNEENPARLILAKIEQQVPSIASLRSDLPGWLSEGIDGLLERSPATRMDAVRAFAVALDRHSSYVPAGSGRRLAESVDVAAPSQRVGSWRDCQRLYLALPFTTLLWVLLISLFVLPISQTEMFSRLEASHADMLYRLRGPGEPHPGIVVVSMDEQSCQRLGVPLTGHWPRLLHAKLLNALADAGAKRVVFDVIFANSDRENESDRALAEAMKRVPTVLGAALGLSQRATINGAFLLEELLQPAEMFEAESVGIGVVGLPLNLGRVREFPRAVSEVFSGITTLAEMAVALDRDDTTAPPVGSLINFYGPGRSIPTIPYELVVSDESPLPRAVFEGKVVFVGLGLRSSTGASQRDAFITPYDQQTFGAEIHATAASNLLKRDWIQQPSNSVAALMTFGWAVVLSAIIVVLSGVRTLITLGTAVTLICLFQFFLFLSGSLIPVVGGVVWGIFSGLLLRIALVPSSARLWRGRL